MSKQKKNTSNIGILTGKKYKKFVGSLMISSVVKSAKDPNNNFS